MKSRFWNIAVAAMIILSVAALAVLITRPAHSAPTMCPFPRSDVIKSLSDQYGERPAAVGALPSGVGVMEVWASEGGGTWTMFFTMPDGSSCPGVSGTDWQSIEPAPPASTDPEA